MQRHRLPWILFALALVAALAFGWLWRQAGADGRRQAQVKGVAADFLLTLTNFDAKTIDADVAKIKGFAVGDFAGQVDQFFGPDIVSQIKRANAKSTGRVRSVVVESIGGGQASIFAVVDEKVSNQNTPERSEVIRFELTMIDTKDGWKVENVQVLQTPGATPLVP
jgi:hypothetical protein